MTAPAAPVVEVRELSFHYGQDRRQVLDRASLVVARGERCLVVGANGAGKTTLLRVVAGKHLTAPESVRVLGASAFHDTSLAARVEYLGGVFAFAVDMRVAEIVEAARGVDPARRERLIELLGIDLDWHMHRVSDGQRRRVQLLLGLMRPRELLLLDEITTDLDLLARQDLLGFLREETEARGVTILYASHILDRLEDWATHLVYVRAGRVELHAALADLAELRALRASHATAPLMQLIEGWLRRDRGG